MEEKEHCCGTCANLGIEEDYAGDTHYYCSIIGCDDIDLDEVPCCWYEEEK